MAFFAEKARPAAVETPKVRMGRHPGDRPAKTTGGENAQAISSRRETKPWRGRNPGEDRVAFPGKPESVGNGLPEGSKPGSRARRFGTTGTPFEPTSMPVEALRKRPPISGRENLRRAQPQERHRHETRPEGSGRIKPSGGCETLKADRSGEVNPITDSRFCERCRGRNPMGVASFLRERGGFFRPHSVGEPKSMRG